MIDLNPQTLDGLARLVHTMRLAQRAYFHRRQSADLDAARVLEAQVDQACLQIIDRQRRLFDEDAP